jgi:SAM-dependent methyltransferase
MLAVFEHVTPERLVSLVSDIRRVLTPGGLYVLTTPAKWTDALLRHMARAGLVSSEEIDDHKAQYTHPEIAAVLTAAGFAANHQRFGYFQGYLNLWATARK